jgi:transcription antitermination factor NusG
MPETHHQPPKEELTPGDRVRVDSGDFQNFKGEVVSLSGSAAAVRFVIFGRDCGIQTLPRSILTKI